MINFKTETLSERMARREALRRVAADLHLADLHFDSSADAVERITRRISAEVTAEALARKIARDKAAGKV